MEIFASRTQAFSMPTTWHPQVLENVILNYFQHHRCIGVGVSCNFTDTMGGKWQTTCMMADFMAIGLCCQLLCQFGIYGRCSVQVWHI